MGPNGHLYATLGREAPMDRLANTFEDLEVYCKAVALADEVFEVTRSFPGEEMYALTDQLRRASRSIGAQIAEAWSRRHYRKHFTSKLTDADAEQMETRHWLRVASQCGYLTLEQTAELQDQASQIGKMIQGMISKSAEFCRERRSHH